MAKRSRQTFKKRQREMAREQKRQDKAQRTAARKTKRNGAGNEEEDSSAPAEVTNEKPTLQIIPIGRSAAEPDKK